VPTVLIPLRKLRCPLWCPDRIQSSVVGRFGDSLKNQATGATAWILAGEPRLAKVIGLKPSRRIPLFNGPIECRLLKFEMYEGTKKHKGG